MAAPPITACSLLAALMTTLLVGCAAPTPTVTPSDGITIRGVPCATARVSAVLSGVLVREPRSGVGLRDGAGETWQVIWPYGYSVRDDGGRFALLGTTGTILAHEGDLVGIGGEIEDGVWIGCGGIVPP